MRIIKEERILLGRITSSIQIFMHMTLANISQCMVLKYRIKQTDNKKMLVDVMNMSINGNKVEFGLK